MKCAYNSALFFLSLVIMRFIINFLMTLFFLFFLFFLSQFFLTFLKFKLTVSFFSQNASVKEKN